MSASDAAELAATRLFRGVDPAVLAGLVSAAFTRRLARGQILFVAGEPAEHVFLVRSGRLKVHVSSARGDELVLDVVGSGAVLGEISVLDGGARSADIVALDACELLAIPIAAVQDVLRTDPHALRAAVDSLAAGMRRLTDQAADLVFLDLPRRLAKLLVRSADETDGDGQAVARLGLSQSEIAAMLGVTRQSVNKAMSGLSKRGWIDSDPTGIRLLDRTALQHFVSS